jgi:hypothetical protein
MKVLHNLGIQSTIKSSLAAIKFKVEKKNLKQYFVGSCDNGDLRFLIYKKQF